MLISVLLVGAYAAAAADVDGDDDEFLHLIWPMLKLYMIGSHARIEYRLKIGIE